ncbi:MAG: glycoside hydrolase family 127 protein, partial [Duncaniella sp.]|nr:glycoside hydrolase family 127 protein [Duncaniella sp.]
SGDRFFYDNPLESMGQHERQKWFGCACCPGNVTRFIASVPGYIYATYGNDIFVNLYVQSGAEIKTASQKVGVTQHTAYPWSGNIRLEISPERKERFALKLRIPGWVENKPVPTDLYSFTQPATQTYIVKVNGKAIDTTFDQGYATIERKWKKGDVVELDLPMEIRRVRANDSVCDDHGKLAFQRGPIVYCLEGIDQGDGSVFDKYIPENVNVSATFIPNFLQGVVILEGNAKKVSPEGEETVGFKAIPYCTWNNRGAGEMAVWIPERAEGARMRPESTIASSAVMYSEPTGPTTDVPAATSNLQGAWGYNDQWEPKSSADTSKPYHYWWLRFGSDENICDEFQRPETVSR